MSARDLESILTTDPEHMFEFHLTVNGKWQAMHLGGGSLLRDGGYTMDFRGFGFEDMCNATDARVAIVPRNSPRAGDVSAYAGCLWARLETKKHAEALSRFRRGPSMVIREGRTQRRWALWWLQDPLRLDVVARGNRALAFTLGCVQKYGAEPETLFLPCPGSLMTLGRPKPLEVAVEFTAPDRRYRPGDFRGVVRKPPEKSTEWRRAA